MIELFDIDYSKLTKIEIRAIEYFKKHKRFSDYKNLMIVESAFLRMNDFQMNKIFDCDYSCCDSCSVFCCFCSCGRAG